MYRFPSIAAHKIRLNNTDQFADFVGAKTGAEILAYESDEDDLLVSMLWS